MVATKELGFMTNLRLLVVSFNSIELAINELRITRPLEMTSEHSSK